MCQSNKGPIQRAAGIALIHVAVWVAAVAAITTQVTLTEFYDDRLQKASVLAESLVVLTHLLVDYHFRHQSASPAGAGLWPAQPSDLTGSALGVYRGPMQTRSAVGNLLQHPIPEATITFSTRDVVGTPQVDDWLLIRVAVQERDRLECPLSTYLESELYLKGFPAELLSTVNVVGSTQPVALTCTPGTAVNPRATGVITIRVPSPEAAPFLASSPYGIPVIQNLMARQAPALRGDLDAQGFDLRDVAFLRNETGVNLRDFASSDIAQQLFNHLNGVANHSSGVWEVEEIRADRLVGGQFSLFFTLSNYFEGLMTDQVTGDSLYPADGRRIRTTTPVTMDFGMGFAFCNIDFANAATLIVNGVISTPHSNSPHMRTALEPLDQVNASDMYALVEQTPAYSYVTKPAATDRPNQHEVGMLAQDFEDVPWLSLQGDDGYLKLSYYGLVPILWSTARELDDRFGEEATAVQELVARRDRVLAIREALLRVRTP